ncbi:hypothetical protein K7432_005703 [Basidiobolus ranarum]|uniref:Uncharacterized protein n=1 Tax=Basidiobolus ranarum TaxID=34480 RepID=A0ABR2W2Q2_9FUNG
MSPGNHQYDFIVVGGGSAGAVVASRLSENPNVTVLLIEGGKAFPVDQYPKEVASSSFVYGTPDIWWGIPEKNRAGQPKEAIRTKILGGGSAINACVWVRALPTDFKRWTEEYGLEGWSFEDVLPYFKKSEDDDIQVEGSIGYHGVGGPTHVHRYSPEDISSLHTSSWKAMAAAGHPEVQDFNGKFTLGVGAFPFNIKDNKRLHTGITYLNNGVRDRPNLTIISETTVDKIIFEGTTATGIITTEGVEFTTLKEVILTAGAIGTGSILIRSGIGPKEDLEKLSISVIANLPVGKNLQDHGCIYNIFSIKSDSLKIEDGMPLLTPYLWTASTTAKTGEQDLHIVPTGLADPKLFPDGSGLAFLLACVRPEARGSLKLISKDAEQAPLIDANLFGDKRDILKIIDAISLTSKIMQSGPMVDASLGRVYPPPDMMDTETLSKWISDEAMSYHHITSTAPMGRVGDARAVVDSHGRVFGIQGLRIADASCHPDVVSAAINPTTIAVAEKITHDIQGGSYRG